MAKSKIQEGEDTPTNNSSSIQGNMSAVVGAAATIGTATSKDEVGEAVGPGAMPNRAGEPKPAPTRGQVGAAATSDKWAYPVDPI